MYLIPILSLIFSGVLSLKSFNVISFELCIDNNMVVMLKYVVSWFTKPVGVFGLVMSVYLLFNAKETHKDKGFIGICIFLWVLTFIQFL